MFPLDMKLGRNVARTFLDYYRLNNLIDDNKPTNLSNRFSYYVSFTIVILCLQWIHKDSFVAASC